MQPILNELLRQSFLIDENTIDTYDEIIYQFKLPQLKELTKKYPNDYEFGREMRKFINRVNITKKRTIDGKIKASYANFGFIPYG